MLKMRCDRLASRCAALVARYEPNAVFNATRSTLLANAIEFMFHLCDNDLELPVDRPTRLRFLRLKLVHWERQVQDIQSADELDSMYDSMMLTWELLILKLKVHRTQ